MGLTSDNPPLSLEYTALFLFLSFTCLCKCARMYLLSVHCNQIQFNSTQAKRLLNRPPCLHSLHNRVFFVSASSLSLFCPLSHEHMAKQKPQDTGCKNREQGDAVTIILCRQIATCTVIHRYLIIL